MPVVPLVVFVLEIIGAESDMVNTTSWLPVPEALVAVTVELYVPAVVGVPEMTPVPVSTLNPGGKLVAPKLVVGGLGSVAVML